MSRVIGIDLGTSNSVVSFKALAVEVLENSEGELFTPSCVYFKPDVENPLSPEGHLVGRSAINWLKQAPLSTIRHIKRLMGHSFDSEVVNRFIQAEYFGQRVRSSKSEIEKNVVINIPNKKEGGVDLSPEEISSLILSKLKRDCEEKFGRQICDAVITVPAYFNDKQKHATKIAAQKAGLNPLRLLPEPTAAAIAFGVSEEGGRLDQTIMVYDFGGGTLDISILTVSGGTYIEQAKGGDMWLGGSDIDLALYQLILRKASENEGVDFFALWGNLKEKERSRLTRDLLEEAEKAKIALSSEQTAVIQKLGIIEDSSGIPLDIDIMITRDELNECIESFLNQGIELMATILNSCSLNPELIDRVLLVGGSSQIPLLQEKIANVFGIEKVLVHPRPMLAVAEGAAILAHKMEGEESLQDEGFTEILHTSAHDYYLELEGDQHKLLIPRHSPLPVTKSFHIELKNNTQKLFHLAFSNKINDEFKNMGHLWLTTGTEFESSKKLIIKLDFTVSEDNLISITTSCKDNDNVNMTLAISRGKEDEVLYHRLEELVGMVQDVDDYYCKMDFEYRMANVIPVINRVLDVKTESVDCEAQAKANYQLDLADQSLKQKESIITNIYYLEDFFSIGSVLGKHQMSQDQKGKEAEVKEKLKQLKRGYFSRNFQESVALKNEIFSEIDVSFSARRQLLDSLSEDDEEENYAIETGFNLIS